MAIRFKEETKPKRKAVGKILEGLSEAIAIAKGEAEPAKVHKAKRGRPRLENVDQTLAARKPWLSCKPPMSRSTWYRRLKEDAST